MDFKQTLKIRVKKDSSGRLSLLGLCEYEISKENLADGSIEVVEMNKSGITLGEACSLIDDFAFTDLNGRKAAIRRFLRSNIYECSKEY